MIQDASELVEAIRDALELASKWEPEHPQYIQGMFYLTENQWSAIRREWPLRPGFNDGQSVWGIPVQIIKPNERVELPSGDVLVYSAALKHLYVFDPKVAQDAGLT